MIICKINEHCALCDIGCQYAEEYAPVHRGYWAKHAWAEEVEGLLIDNYECTYCHNWIRDATQYCPHRGSVMGLT